MANYKKTKPHRKLVKRRFKRINKHTKTNWYFGYFITFILTAIIMICYFNFIAPPKVEVNYFTFKTSLESVGLVPYIYITQEDWNDIIKLHGGKYKTLYITPNRIPYYYGSGKKFCRLTNQKILEELQRTIY